MATCGECIHRDFCNVHGYIDAEDCKVYKNKADFVEVKHGKWVNVPFTQQYSCSLCGKEIYFGKDKFCNECGARMDGDT